ncbi:TPA: hypothetical protein QDZ12_004215 [Pseudomonas putida]|nr:hypothetical protein [Pseudomonas sp. HD6515]ELS0926029.1 hypothetical protein [Pseudomonas putida]UWH23457.1 hypothetical protein KW568_03290 [Pseudomonas sp. HD6515]HDS0940917.1 hypothetical protein [Pseudomonas putida]
MPNKCRAVIAPNFPLIVEALHRQGFFLFRDLPLGTTIRFRGDMCVVRFP